MVNGSAGRQVSGETGLLVNRLVGRQVSGETGLQVNRLVGRHVIRSAAFKKFLSDDILSTC